MRSLIAGILCFTGIWFVSLACLAQTPQQEQPQPAPPPDGGVRQAAPSRDGGVREVLESIVVPPIAHAPFYATLATEWVKYAADGGSMTLVNERHIARDAQGRVYEERWILVPKNSEMKSYMNWIQIGDPKQHTLYNCSPQRHVCDLLTYDPAHDLGAAILRKGATRQLKNGTRTWEELGTRNILGVETVGVRDTTITDAGTMGNDQPLTNLSEYWHSDQLGINLLSIRSSPFFGKQTFTMTELTASDPDPQLFELPAGYKINDKRQNSPISQ
jgi:hypothetical protein